MKIPMKEGPRMANLPLETAREFQKVGDDPLPLNGFQHHRSQVCLGSRWFLHWGLEGKTDLEAMGFNGI